MRSQNTYYYRCEKGHITTGDSNRKTKCEMKIREVKLVKKGKAGVEKETVRETTCNEKLIDTIELPKELDYFSTWKPELIKAFLQGQPPQALREGFLVDIQRIMTGIKTEMISLRTELETLKTDCLKLKEIQNDVSNK
jgi:hypothetical protein